MFLQVFFMILQIAKTTHGLQVLTTNLFLLVFFISFRLFPKNKNKASHYRSSPAATSRSDRRTHKHNQRNRETSKKETRTLGPLPSVRLPGSFVSSLLYQVLGGWEGGPWNDSWHDGSQSSPGWAVWYQHFSAWLWTSETAGFAVISPGCSSRCICSADWS